MTNGWPAAAGAVWEKPKFVPRNNNARAKTKCFMMSFLLEGVEFFPSSRSADATRLTLSGADAVLPMRPHKPDDSGCQNDSDDEIELVKILSQLAPVFSELHAEPSQREAPGPGTKKSIDMKSSARHAGNTGRQRDKRTHHGK